MLDNNNLPAIAPAQTAAQDSPSSPAPAHTSWLLITIRLFIPLLAGIIVGVLGVMLFMSATPKTYTLILAAACGALAFALVAFLISRLTTDVIRARFGASHFEVGRDFVKAVWLRFVGFPLEDVQASEIARRGSLAAQTTISALVAASLLTVAVGLAGTLLLLGQTLAAYQQVDRLDAQNRLLELEMDSRQRNESRVLYLSQLEPLINGLEKAREAQIANVTRWGERWIGKGSKKLTENHHELADEITDSYPGQALYLSDSLHARISSVLFGLTPASRKPGFDKSFFNSERGQLFGLLMTYGVQDLDHFDFTRADLEGLVLFQGDAGGTTSSDVLNEFIGTQRRPVPEMDLQDAWLRGATFNGVNLSRADLRGAFLPEAADIIGKTPPLPHDVRLPRLVFVSYWPSLSSGAEHRSADLDGAFVPDQKWLSQMRATLGGQHIDFSLYKTVRDEDAKAWKLERDPDSARLQAEFFDPPFEFDPACDSSVTAAWLKRLAALVNAQKLDSDRMLSREKGEIILLWHSHLVTCLQREGANLRNAWLGFQDQNRELVLDGLDLSESNFEFGRYRSISARGASLPKADAFRHLAVGEIVLDGARVPDGRWLTELRRELSNLSNWGLWVTCDERVVEPVSKLPADVDPVAKDSCAWIDQYSIVRREVGGQDGYVIVRK